jgi:hypothetical protein
VVAALLDLDEGAGAALEAPDQVPCGLAHRHDVVDQDTRGWSLSKTPGAKVSARSFSRLPTTWSTSAMAA